MSSKKRGSFSLYGEAAGAWIRMQEGTPSEDDEERALRVATMVAVFLGPGMEQGVAVAVVQKLAKDGLEKTADYCTKARRAAEAAGA